MYTERYYPVFEVNAHVSKLLEHFGSIDKRHAALPADLSYIFVCFTNRCGSNYLAELLSSSGHYNLAGEDLNWDTVRNHATRLGLPDFHSYFSFLSGHLSKSKTVFMKIATSQIDLLGRAGILDQIFDRSQFILVERSDKLGQAISHSIAFSTGRFTSWMPGSRPVDDLSFSKKQIDNIINGIANQYRDFDLFFARNGIAPVVVVYEQLIADPDAYVGFITRQLGMENFRISPEKLRLERQAGSVNADWREQYMREAFVR